MHYVEPWLSEADIKAGEPWSEAVAKELEAANLGLICVTKENMGSTWLHFEAGAIAKSMSQSRVVPLLLDLGVKDLIGPLARFQAMKVELAGLRDVVESINQTEKQAVPDARVKELFDALWPRFEEKVASIPMPAAAAKHARPQPEILEELVASVRSLDSRVREVSGDSLPIRRSKRFRFHPFMLHELMHMMGESPDDRIGLLILASMLRDDMPWLYKLGIEAYRAARRGPSDEAERAAPVPAGSRALYARSFPNGGTGARSPGRSTCCNTS